MTNKIIVALIEDNDEDTLAVERVLKNSIKTVYEVHVYRSLGEAISGISSENKPDAILVDLSLPDAPDKEMAVRLIAAMYTSSAIIVYTATDEIGVATAAMLLGADDYVVKTISSLEHLDLTINICVARKNIEMNQLVMSQQVSQIEHFISHFMAGMPKLLRRCAVCHDIWHAPSRRWVNVFDFIEKVTDIRFTDGFCNKPECKSSVAKAIHELGKNT